VVALESKLPAASERTIDVDQVESDITLGDRELILRL
jgi:hypothetical protein